MKKHVILLLVPLFAIILAACPRVEAATGLEDREVVAENEYLVLYFNEQDTSFAVQCKQSGKIWLSNPPAGSSSPTTLRSQINIVHDPDRVTKDNYGYSNQYERSRVTQIDNGVRVDYQFVEKWTANDYLPQLVRAAKFDDRVLNKLQGKDRQDIRSSYYLIQLRKLEEGEERVEIKGLTAEDIFEDYTLEILDDDHQEAQTRLEELKRELQQVEGLIASSGSDDEDLPRRRTKLESDISRLERDLQWQIEDITWHLIQNVILANRADITRIEEITFQDVEQLVDTPTYMRKTIPRFSLTRLSEVVESVGYTPLDATEDHIENNINPTVPNLEIFEVSIEYRLDGDSLLVTIPVDDVKYPIKVVDFEGEEHTYPIVFLEMLPYFSAAGLNDEGYILVPDGSGALIYLNNGKIWTSTYNQAVYGRDYTEDPPAYATTYPQQIHLPVFGLKKGDQAFLGIIERGDAIAHLRADISGKRDDFNRIFPRFNIIKSGTISLQHGGSFSIYQPEMYKGDIRVRYVFLVGEEADYSGMARRYREYLVENGLLTPLKSGDPPFLLELIGAFPRTEIMVGIPRSIPYPATTFADAKGIFDDLTGAGIDNVQLRYRGWLRGGLEHQYPDNVAVEGNLGSEAELKALVAYIQENGGAIYPDVGFLSVYRNRLFDSFIGIRDAARRLDQLTARVYDYNIATFEPETASTAMVVSPRVLERLVSSFMSGFDRFGSNGISLSQMGWQLNSDFNKAKGRTIDRQQAAEITRSQMDRISQKYEVMVQGGNLYTLPHTSIVVNMPLEDSGYDIVDQRIPFYQMVVSGCLTYAGEPLNLVSDARSYTLMSLEAGALPYFSVAAAESEVVKGTRYDKFHSFNYGQWREAIIDCYLEYYPVYEQIYGRRFVQHQLLQDGVTKSTFENGVSIVVNYNDYAVEYKGRTIGAKGYCLLEEDAR